MWLLSSKTAQPPTMAAVQSTEPPPVPTKDPAPVDPYSAISASLVEDAPSTKSAAPRVAVEAPPVSATATAAAPATSPATPAALVAPTPATAKEVPGEDGLSIAKAILAQDPPPKEQAKGSSSDKGWFGSLWRESPEARLDKINEELRLDIRRKQMTIKRMERNEQDRWAELTDAQADELPEMQLASLAEGLAGVQAGLRRERADLKRLQNQSRGIVSVNETKRQLDVMSASKDAMQEHMERTGVTNAYDMAAEHMSQRNAQTVIKDAIELAGEDDGDDDEEDGVISVAARRILDATRPRPQAYDLPNVPMHVPTTLGEDRHLAERLALYK